MIEIEKLLSSIRAVRFDVEARRVWSSEGRQMAFQVRTEQVEFILSYKASNHSHHTWWQLTIEVIIADGKVQILLCIIPRPTQALDTFKKI